MNLIDLFRNAEPRDPKWDGTAWEPEPVDMPRNDCGGVWLLGLFVGHDHATITVVSDEAVKQAQDRHNGDLDEALKEIADRATRKRK